MSWDSWTGFWGVDDFLQGFDPQAKPSTRLLARGGSAVTCDDDVSQYETDLSTNVTYCFEASTTRFNYSHPRTMGFRLLMDNADTGLLFRHGSGANTETFGFSAANTLRLQVANAVIWTQTLTVLTGSVEEIVVAWATEANPDTTGAADAVRSVVYVWNVDAGTFERFEVGGHVVKALQAGATAVWGANTHPAGTAFSGTITGWWYENRYQSGAEIAADWVAAVTPPTTVLTTVHQGHPPEADTIDAQNEQHGPAAIWAADSTRRVLRRTLSPLVNRTFNTTPTWTDALLVATDPMIRGYPGASDYRMHVAWSDVVPVPPTANAAWVRIHLRSWTSSGAAVPIGVRYSSFNRRPGMALPPGDQGAADPLVPYYVEATVTRDDDSSDGEWTVFDQLLPLSRGRAGIMANRTCLALALNVDPAGVSGNDANAQIWVRAINVVPLFDDRAGGFQPVGGFGS